MFWKIPTTGILFLSTSFSKRYLEKDTFKNKEFTYKICLDPQSETSPLDTPASLSHETKQEKKYSFSQSFWK